MFPIDRRFTWCHWNHVMICLFWSRASFIPLDSDFRYFGLCGLQTPNFQFQFPSMTANPKKTKNVYCHIFSLKSMYECELPLLVPDRAHAQNEPSAGNTKGTTGRSRVQSVYQNPVAICGPSFEKLRYSVNIFGFPVSVGSLERQAWPRRETTLKGRLELWFTKAILSHLQSSTGNVNVTY